MVKIQFLLLNRTQNTNTEVLCTVFIPNHAKTCLGHSYSDCKAKVMNKTMRKPMLFSKVSTCSGEFADVQKLTSMEHNFSSPQLASGSRSSE